MCTAAAAASHQLRAGASHLDVSSGRAWDYNDEGKSWKTGTCKSAAQSPVNISTTVAAQAPDKDIFFFKYPSYETPVKMVNDGRFLYTVFPNADGRIGGFALGQSYPSFLTVSYYLHKMVIHTPSEHTYGGKKVPLEIQLFHRKKGAALTDGEPAAADTAVVAIGFAESRDEASPFLRSLIDGGLPDQRGGSTLDNRAFPSVLKFSELFKPVFGAQGQKAGFWDYTGSLTQPPCTEGVRWFVRQEPLNAKAKTLKYFTNSVKKSSGGVPGNARMLQVIGTRPVVARFARNAVHMASFNPKEPDAFKEALKNVKDNQAAFKDGLKKDKAGAGAAMKAGASPTDAVLASNDYKACMKAFGDVNVELKIAASKQTDDCNKAKGAEKTLKSISGGAANMEASAKLAAAKKTCEDQTKVATALKGQASTQQTQCNDVKSKVKKKADKALAASNAKAGSKAPAAKK